MANSNQNPIDKLGSLVRQMVDKLETGIASGGLIEDPGFERLFGTKKSYADVLIDLSEIMLKLQASTIKPSAYKIASESSFERIDDHDVSLIKYYLNRQRQLAEASIENAG